MSGCGVFGAWCGCVVWVCGSCGVGGEGTGTPAPPGREAEEPVPEVVGQSVQADLPIERGKSLEGDGGRYDGYDPRTGRNG